MEDIVFFQPKDDNPLLAIQLSSDKENVSISHPKEITLYLSSEKDKTVQKIDLLSLYIEPVEENGETKFLLKALRYK